MTTSTDRPPTVTESDSISHPARGPIVTRKRCYHPRTPAIDATQETDEQALPHQERRGHPSQPRGGRGGRPQAHALGFRPRDARHRRRHRRRHLLDPGHRRGRRAGRQAGRGPGPGALVRAAGRRLRAGRPLLRGAHGDDPDRGQRLHLRLRHPRRGRRLDHRLGPDARVRDRERRGGDRLVRLLLLVPARLRHRVAALAHDQLSERRRRRIPIASASCRLSSAITSPSTSRAS